MPGLGERLGAKANAVLHKAKVAASTSRERVGKLTSRFSSGVSDDDAVSAKRIARLDTKFFATPDRAIAADKTFGLIKLELQEAELSEPGSYAATVAIGEQTFASAASEQTRTPKWGADRNLVLQRGEATMARISVSRIQSASGIGLGKSKPKRELVGFCEVDLAAYFLEASGVAQPDVKEDGRRQVSVDHDGASEAKAAARQAEVAKDDEPVSSWHDLKSPTDFSKHVGRIRVKTQSATLQHLEKQFWGRALKIADLNMDGSLELSEFRLLMQAFGAELSGEQIEELYRKADRDGSDDVDEDELAACLTAAHGDGEISKLIKRCPVSGAELVPGDDWGNLIYMTLCMDQGSGHTLQGSGDPNSGETWMLKMSEWAPQSLGGALSAGQALESKGEEGNFSRIIVYDRQSHRLVEEQISPTLVLAMRNMYQSRMGAVMLKAGAFNTLELMSKEEGRHMDAPESVKNIPEFLKSFSGEVDMSEALEPLESYKTFNEFFFRKLKPSARPIAQPNDEDVAVSAADCRLSSFASISDATRCWIKGRKFSVAGLLADGVKAAVKNERLAPSFEGGSMFIFRLAPQDYHRFHLPVSGTLRSIRQVNGKLYTVNPIAVASTYANVFTQNKRAVVMLDSPHFGPVAIIAIGATMVGSIRFTAEQGKEYRKGDELGYFAFGGSTVIVLFGKDAITIDQDLLHNSKKSLETLVKMGTRLGCRPNSPHLRTQSADAQDLAELETQTAHLAPLDEAMGGVHLQKEPASGGGDAPPPQPPAGASPTDSEDRAHRVLSRTATAIPVHRRHVIDPGSSSDESSDAHDEHDDEEVHDSEEVLAEAEKVAAAAQAQGTGVSGQ